MGVYSGSETISIQQFGYNKANFGIPDTRNLVLKNAKIKQDVELDTP